MAPPTLQDKMFLGGLGVVPPKMSLNLPISQLVIKVPNVVTLDADLVGPVQLAVDFRFKITESWRFVYNVGPEKFVRLVTGLVESWVRELCLGKTYLELYHLFFRGYAASLLGGRGGGDHGGGSGSDEVGGGAEDPRNHVGSSSSGAVVLGGTASANTTSSGEGQSREEGSAASKSGQQGKRSTKSLAFRRSGTVMPDSVSDETFKFVAMNYEDAPLFPYPQAAAECNTTLQNFLDNIFAGPEGERTEIVPADMPGGVLGESGGPRGGGVVDASKNRPMASSGSRGRAGDEHSSSGSGEFQRLPSPFVPPGGEEHFPLPGEGINFIDSQDRPATALSTALYAGPEEFTYKRPGSSSQQNRRPGSRDRRPGSPEQQPLENRTNYVDEMLDFRGIATEAELAAVSGEAVRPPSRGRPNSRSGRPGTAGSQTSGHGGAGAPAANPWTDDVTARTTQQPPPWSAFVQTPNLDKHRGRGGPAATQNAGAQKMRTSDALLSKDLPTGHGTTSPPDNCFGFRHPIGVSTERSQIWLCHPIALAQMESWHFYEGVRRREVAEHAKLLKGMVQEVGGETPQEVGETPKRE